MTQAKVLITSGVLSLAACTGGDDSEAMPTSAAGSDGADDGVAATGVATGPATDSGDTGGDPGDEGDTVGDTGTPADTADDDPMPPIWFDVGLPADGTGEGGGDCQGGATVLEATIRDFASTHPDFEAFWGSAPTTGLVLDALGADATPQYNPAVPVSPGGSSATQITSAGSFSDWYHDVGGTNVAVPFEIELEEDPVGSGQFVFDDATFFPVDNAGWNGAPGPNNETFPDTLDDQHNFHFTTEIHTSFVYAPGQVFTFIGDDDLWVFVDGSLVIDLGGLHGELEGSVEMDTLGLDEGRTYAMDVFHAERRHNGSHFRIETSIACFFPPAG